MHLQVVPRTTDPVSGGQRADVGLLANALGQ
jgi:hypothetical protein